MIREAARGRPETVAVRRVRREERGYPWWNRELRLSPFYVWEGFALGAGAVEGACQNTVGARLRREEAVERGRWSTSAPTPKR